MMVKLMTSRYYFIIIYIIYTCKSTGRKLDPAMATLGLFPSSVAASTAIRAPAPAAPTRASNRQPPHARRLPVLGRRAPAMDALRVSGAAEPLLRPAAGGHPRLRVRRPTDPTRPAAAKHSPCPPLLFWGGRRGLSLVVKGLTEWRMCRCGPMRRAGAAPGVAPRRRGTLPSRGHPSSSRKIFSPPPSRIVAFEGLSGARTRWVLS